MYCNYIENLEQKKGSLGKMKKSIVKFASCCIAGAVLVSPFGNMASASGGVSAQEIPGDYNNSCKVISTKYYNNVSFNNYESGIVNFIATGGVGSIGYALTKSAWSSFVVSGLRGAFAKVPKQKYVWTKIQTRECKDSTGIHRQLIITYYSDSKRTKEIGTEYKKVS